MEDAELLLREGRDDMLRNVERRSSMCRSRRLCSTRVVRDCTPGLACRTDVALTETVPIDVTARNAKTLQITRRMEMLL